MAFITAEHFVVTNELGGSTTGERAATIASVISGAATLTATNTAVYSAADAEELVASQTFRLTTGLDARSRLFFNRFILVLKHPCCSVTR